MADPNASVPNLPFVSVNCRAISATVTSPYFPHLGGLGSRGGTDLDHFPIASGAAEPLVRYTRHSRRAPADDYVNNPDGVVAPVHYECLWIWVSSDEGHVVNLVGVSRVTNRSTPFPADPSHTMSKLTTKKAMPSFGTETSLPSGVPPPCC